MPPHPINTRRGLARGALGLGAAALVAPRAMAQSAWPDHPLRLIIGYPPGGASDLFGRMIAAQMGPRLGQNVVVENRPGGGAVVASEAVSRSPADGYTLLHVDNGILVYNPALYARLPYDPEKDLAGVGFIGRFPLFLVVRADSPVQDLAGYIAAARARVPTYGTPAVASPHHLAMEMFKRRAGFDATHVPYRGGPAAMQDLLAGTVDSVMIDCATGTAFIRDGKVRALCVLSEARSPTSPEVPTARELGFGSAVAYGWQGICVPAGTPAPVVARLSTELARAIASDEMSARFTTLGIERANYSPAEFAAFVAKENGEWRPLIRELGIRLDS
ncbi:Bug family tripartite tricarboxylate transporter substrate binding protein [Pararoseomonas indoligenes]|uniref:Tripartite tricarboxylate transporter substrate binding protein n=1 Tax=Roseomonas indoligenes TaxID=2820811 RepID=A0A940S7T1_9PROT|nr:tripartite tricarboxylate transporter substrate binding protein [Pararoseomonas indoligenes]MBP0493392.1 tripartite tricarboxylate transporter substrate binding protein [Pararoseomonas indoligenes]